MPVPKISLITPCLNRERLIREAVESAMHQEYPALEHIVIDGASTDRTLDVLREYPHLRVVSEPDTGMYNAINKGIRLARGEIIGLLNTDDLLAEGALEAVAQAFNEHPDAMAVVGGVTTFSASAQGWQVVNAAPAIEPDELWDRLIHGHPVTNAWFFRREVFEKLGGFDERLKWSADRYFLIHIALDGGVRPVPVRKVLYHYRQHGDSVTISNLDSRDPKYGLLRIKFLQEDVFALEEFLQRNNVPAGVRRRLRREHGRRCYRVAATALYHRQWQTAFNAIQAGFSRNWLWPAIFVEMALARLFKGSGG